MQQRLRPQVVLMIGILGVTGLGSLPAWAQRDESVKPSKSDKAAQSGSPPATKPAEVKAPGITSKAVEAKQKRASELKDLPEETKKKILDFYQRAADQMKLADDFHARADRLEKSRADAPEETKQLKQAQARPLAEPSGSALEAPLAQLEKNLADADARLEEVRKQAAKWEAEPKRRTDRRGEISKLVATAKERLEQLDKDIEAKPPAGEHQELTAARQTFLKAQRAAIEAELDMYDKEIRLYDATNDLVVLRRDASNRELAQLQKEVTLWRSAVNQQRKLEAERAAQKAVQQERALETPDVIPQIKALAQENLQLAKIRQQLVADIERADAAWETMKSQLRQLEREQSNLTERVEKAGLTNATGMLLRQQQEKLPDIRRARRQLRSRQATLSQVQLDLLDFEQQRAEYADLDSLAQRILAGVSVPEEDRKDVEHEVQQLLKARRESLDAIIKDHYRYSSRLVDLDASGRQLIAEAEKLSNFIRERIMWVRSVPAIDLAEIDDVQDLIGFLWNPFEWVRAGMLLVDDAKSHPALLSITFVVFVMLLVVRGRMRRQLRHLGEQASKSYNADFLPTARAMVLTLLIAIVGPIPLWFVAWRLTATDAALDIEFVVSLADGLMALAGSLLFIELGRQVCREGGLAVAHLGWHPRAVRLLRRSLRMVAIFGLPMVFIVAVAQSENRVLYNHSPGRVPFLLGMGVVAIFVARVGWPGAGVLKEEIAAHPHGWLARLERPLFFLLLAVPIALGVTAAAGYFHTAFELTARLQKTLWISFAMVLAYSLQLRWILLARRKLAIEQAKKRRAAMQSEGASGSSESAPPSEPVMDLSTINAQTRRISKTVVGLVYLVSLWFVWAEVLPATNPFNQIVLWTQTRQVTELVQVGDGTPQQQTVEKPVPITLADGILALAIVVITVIAGRNLPGLLEISVLQNLPLDAGGRYAIATVSRYVISILGMILAFGAIGIGWSNVQWMAAAITVGLGFGLQEIFANFVSGLILLLERPIRVGDTVTIGDVSGTVTKIRIRATTITDWDRKELIVPNKEFITGRLMNWTLTDPIQRILIKVGVAYGTDPERVLELLVRAARENPLVLKEPEPHALFEGFGSSTLDFSLRAFIPSLEFMLQVRNDLHVRIHRIFREAGIEIAFPQCDIHVRSLPSSGGKVTLEAEEDGEGGEVRIPA